MTSRRSGRRRQRDVSLRLAAGDVSGDAAGRVAAAAGGHRIPVRRTSPDPPRREGQHHRRRPAERSSRSTHMTRRFSRSSAAVLRCGWSPVGAGAAGFAAVGQGLRAVSRHRRHRHRRRAQYEVAGQMAKAHAVFPFTFAIMMGDNMYGSERPQDYEKKFERRTSRCSTRRSSSTRRWGITTIRTSGSTSRST